MSIKSSTSEWIRKGPTQAVAVIAAVTFVVGAVVGLGAGYKIEQSRTSSDAKRLRQELVDARKGKPSAAAALIRQRSGKVTATSSGSISILTKLQSSESLKTSASTVYEKAVRGTLADVKLGSRVLIVSGGREFLVLEAGSKLGREVSKVGKKNILVKAGNGTPAGAVKKTLVTTISKLTPATSADVKNGDEVLAGGQQTTGTTFDTIEVILLLPGSGFAN